MEYHPICPPSRVEEPLDWEDFKISCPCNNHISRTLMHQKMPSDAKCNATGFACEPIACPFLFWLSAYWKHKESLFQFQQKEMQ